MRPFVISYKLTKAIPMAKDAAGVVCSTISAMAGSMAWGAHARDVLETVLLGCTKANDELQRVAANKQTRKVLWSMVDVGKTKRCQRFLCVSNGVHGFGVS